MQNRLLTITKYLRSIIAFGIFAFVFISLSCNIQNIKISIAEKTTFFYFLRHGQTDANLGLVNSQPANLPINNNGIEQAKAIAPIIAMLPLKTICYSPFLRAQETKDIISAYLPPLTQYKVDDLAESPMEVWHEMNKLKEVGYHLGSKELLSFLEQVDRGVTCALSYSDPVLIVAHGGVYLAVCYLLNIEDDKKIDNCELVYFYLDINKRWKIKKFKK